MNRKRMSIVYFLIAALAFAAATLWFMNGDGIGLGVLWSGVGILNLCAAVLYLRRKDK